MEGGSISCGDTECVAPNYAGYPILNDPLYNHCAWGREKGKQGRGVADMDQVCV